MEKVTYKIITLFIVATTIFHTVIQFHLMKS
jgi:hypothetical protein